MKKMARTVLFAVMAVFSTAVFAEVGPCAGMPGALEKDTDGFYKIGTADELYKFACMVNNGETSINGKLTEDICVNACGDGESVLKVDGTLNGDGSNFKQWTPIGTETQKFKGTFDGNGHTISGLYFNDESKDNVGLFGRIGFGSTIQNVGVVDSYFEGDSFVGGVVGYNDTGHVEIVYNTGTVSGVSSVGGVVGRNEGIYVSQVYNVGVVKGKPSSQHTGGVVGYNGANSAVSDVYNTGAVSGGAGVGGVVGSNVGLVSNAYYNTDFYTGSAVGDSVSGVIEDAEGKTTAELASITLPSYWWYAGSGEEPDIKNGKLVYKLPGLKNVGSQPEIEYTGFQPNAEGYYEISTAQELKWFAQLVNSGATNINGRLTEDICVNACGEGKSVLKADGTLNGDGSKFKQWTPIGNNSRKFSGTFNGNGHTISGLYFNNEKASYVGLFGSIVAVAKIQNVGVVDSYFEGNYYVGGVVGYNEKGFVSNAYNAGFVRGQSDVGGIVGNNEGSINIGYNTGVVSGNFVGGVVGWNFGSVSNVYNTGSVNGLSPVGGIVGNNEGSVSNVYNAGFVSGHSDVGGIVGYNDDAVVGKAYYNTEVFCENCRDDYGTGKTATELASLTIGDVDDADFPLLEGETESPWVAGSDEPSGSNGKLVYKLPGLKNVGSQPEIEYTGFQPNADGYYEISTAQELKWFAQLVNSGATNINGRLTEDIVVNLIGGLMPLPDVVILFETNEDLSLENFEPLTPIGTSLMPYTGTFDGADSEGNAHVISRLYFNDESADNVGLFGYIGEGAKIQNVGVVDSYIKGGNQVGGVVGHNDKGAVSNVYNTGAVSGVDQVGGVVGHNDKGTVSNVYNTGAVSGTDNVGGVVGENKGDLSNVYNTGTVGGKAHVGGVAGCNQGSIGNAYNSGIVNGDRQVGGVVGLNHKVDNNDDGLVNNVYNTGTVSGTDNVGGVVGDNGWTLTNSYNSGYVIGSGLYVGGVVGNNWGEVDNSYYNNDFYTGEAFGENKGGKIDNVEGKTTAELASTTLPEGFSSENWKAGSGEQPVIKNGKLVYKLPGLKNVGSQPEIENPSFRPNAEGFYEISNAQELKWFAQLVNGGATDIKGKLTADICLNACDEGESVLKADGTLNGDGSNFTQWTPIGTTSAKFNGTFDGAGHTISGLYFNDDKVSNAGLFGRSTINGSIKNVGVVDSYIKGNEHVGGIVGYNGNCTVSNVFSTSTVEGDTYVGGIAGYNDAGTIVNAYNMGAVSGTNRVAGIAGQNDGTTAHINNVYSSGTISGTNYARGLVGYNSAKKNIDNAYYNTDVFSGKAVGNVDGTNVEGKTTAELAALTIGFEGADFPPLGEEVSPWVKGSGTPVVSNGKLVYKFPGLKIFELQPQPELVLFNVQKGSDGNDYCEIANAEDLFKFAQLVNDGTEGLNAKLTANICLNACGEGDKPLLEQIAELEAQGKLLPESFEQWTPIGTESKPYAGIFDGAGFIISGLYFNDGNADYVGLFGQIGSGAKVHDVGVVDSYFVGRNSVGGVVGFNEGITVSNVYNTGSVSGWFYVGGVVGFNEGLTVSNVYNTGVVSGRENVGGVVGRNSGVVSNVYNTGVVSGTENAGGVVGRNSGFVSYVYYNTEVSCKNCSPIVGTLGKTTAELVTGTSLELDTDVWVLGGVGVNAKQDSLYYPYLKVMGPGAYVLSDVKKYTVTVAVNDETMGTVSGAGEYEYGAEVELSAVANEGYRFTDWEDDVKNAVRTITVTKDETYTANFETIPSSSSEAESSSSEAESSSSEEESSSSEAESSSSEAGSSSSAAASSSSDAKSSSSSAKSSSSDAKSSSSSAKSSSSEAASSSSEAESSSSEAESSSSEAKSSSSDAKSSSSSAKSSSSSAKSSSSSAKSSSSEAGSSSSDAESSSSEVGSSSSDAKSSSSDAKSSSSQKESVIARAALPQFSVTASGKIVSIAGARPNSVVNVFDMQGNLVKTVVTTAANLTFTLPSAGVYIVKNGYTAKRVNVR